MLSPLSISPQGERILTPFCLPFCQGRQARERMSPLSRKEFCHPSRSPLKWRRIRTLSSLLPRETGTGVDVTPLDLPSRGKEIESFSFIGGVVGKCDEVEHFTHSGAQAITIK